MTTELEIIKGLEQEVNKKFDKIALEEIRDKWGCMIALNEEEHVTGISLCETKLHDLSKLEGLKHLTHMKLSSSEIKDISGIKKFPSLTYLYLGCRAGVR
jgi:Leucine-rich repeat (LRR) protein